MALKYTVKVETEWRPKKQDQTEIKGTETPVPKPRKTFETVAKVKSLSAVIGLIEDVLVHQYEKGSLILVLGNIDGVEAEVTRSVATGIKGDPKSPAMMKVVEEFRKVQEAMKAANVTVRVTAPKVKRAKK